MPFVFHQWGILVHLPVKFSGSIITLSPQPGSTSGPTAAHLHILGALLEHAQGNWAITLCPFVLKWNTIFVWVLPLNSEEELPCFLLMPLNLQELKRFPSLTADIAAAATEALERFREESRKTVLRLVEMESSYLTVDFFRKQQFETEKQEKNANPSGPNMDRYTEIHLRRIGMRSVSCMA